MTPMPSPLDVAVAQLAQAKSAAANHDRIITHFVEDPLYCMRAFTRAGYDEATALELTDLTLERRDALRDS